MGIDSLLERRMHWQSDTRHSTVAAVLSHNRFVLLTCYLKVSPPEPAAAPRNPFSFVRSFLAALNESFPLRWCLLFPITIIRLREQCEQLTIFHPR